MALIKFIALDPSLKKPLDHDISLPHILFITAMKMKLALGKDQLSQASLDWHTALNSKLSITPETG